MSKGEGDKDHRELGKTLHLRFLNGSETRVSAEISEYFLPMLVTALRNRFPNLPDPQLLETVAIDTLMKYFDHPDDYDPDKRSLIGYFYLDAYWNLVDKLRGLKKNVALCPLSTEYINELAVNTDTPEAKLLEEASPIVNRVFAELTDHTDREIVLLMMGGVRETEAYAEVLGIQEYTQQEQAVVVKRQKDRLKKLLRRKLTKKRKDG
jgi:DNA-directed RNA polymerase specialized sigma24 family protein